MTQENNSKLSLVWSSTSPLVLKAVTIPVTIWEEKNGSPALSAVQEPSSSQNMCLSLSNHREACYSLQIITNDWFEILDSSELLPNEQKTVLLGVLVAFSQPFNVILMVCVCVWEFTVNSLWKPIYHRVDTSKSPRQLRELWDTTSVSVNITQAFHIHACSLVLNSFLHSSFSPQDIHIQTQKTIKAKCLL